MSEIIHVISSLSRGGRERQLATIVANTNRKQYPSRIVYFNKLENSYIDEYGLTNVSIQVKSKGKWHRLLELNQILKKEKPDVVYTWGNGESLSILVLRSFYKFKFKFINGSVRHGIRSRKFPHYFRTVILHLSPYIVANSYAGLKANNLRRGFVLYNGIDPKFIGKLHVNEKAILRAPLVPQAIDKLLFISVANLVPYKDYFSILKALKELKENGQSFYYLILGDGPMREKIEALIQQFNLVKNIEIIGNVENVDKYLKISDFFLHSSKGEGISNAILEAMYAGLPIIATNVGGVPETVWPGSSALFEYKNDKQLLNILLNLDKHFGQFDKYDPDYLAHLQKFSVETMIKKFEEIIEQVMNG